ncbi:hypothetical protein CDD81_900 [Ophiocordyceps australis]|uniref:Amidoligase enzyme n=1 Tax=Ophiocordyceps australis TaxID=1399860 RepID=A0A2C5YF86_9HYPO|nr:hypothetical protein CDD81_900 [Ophiocordyceps australis]
MAPARLGLELEFMVATLPPESKHSKSQSPGDSRWPDDPADNSTAHPIYGTNLCRKAVCQALARGGLAVARIVDPKPLAGDPDASEETHHCCIDISHTSRLLVWNPERGGSDGRQVRFNYWLVDHEGSINSKLDDCHIKGPKGYKWYAIEINSNILSDQAEFDETLPTVRRALEQIRNSVKVWLNAECGFHMHVSPKHGELDIVVARRTAALVLLVEHGLLLNICHPCRRKSIHARPIRTHSIFAARARAATTTECHLAPEMDLIHRYRGGCKARHGDDPLLFTILSCILLQVDLAALAKGLRAPNKENGTSPDGGRCAFAVSSFGTVEFRYPEASFDVDFLSLWTDVARQMMNIATSSEAQYSTTLYELWQMATSDTRLTWIDWLKALGLSRRAGVCSKRLGRYGGDLRNLNKRQILPEMAAKV